MSLEQYSIEELQEEIWKREIEEKKKNSPKMLDNEKIIKNAISVENMNFINSNIKSIADTGYPLKDFKQYCFESMLELYYGKNIWEWYNNNIKL